MKNLLAKMVLPVLLFGAYHLQIPSIITFVMCLVWMLNLAGICMVFMFSSASADLKIKGSLDNKNLDKILIDDRFNTLSWISCGVNTLGIILLNYPITAATYLVVCGLIIFSYNELKEQYNKLIQEKSE